MATSQIEETRVHRLDPERPFGDGDHVLYWMQSAVRTTHNHALEFAAQLANERAVPLLACFVVDPNYPESSRRHTRFLLEGVAAVAATLRRRRIGLRVEIGSVPDRIGEMAGTATAIVTDRGYLNHLRQWRTRVVENTVVPVFEVETNLVIPVETTSNKAEFAARTIRPKIHRHLDEYLVELRTTPLDHDGTSLDGGITIDDPGPILDRLGVDDSVSEVRLQGGQHQARAALDRFVSDSLGDYAELRGEPGVEATSGISPYLHFGHLSPLTAVLAVTEAAGGKHVDTFIEELVVRRELSHNFTWFQPDYTDYGALPEWARKTLAKHRDDPRNPRYSLDDLEAGDTGDRYWNAAMTEMRETGYLHNYMRMYWGKRILAWTEDPAEAHHRALYLNNRYLLDGRDPNSYAGVGWCFGLHDRPWPEREVFGTVRTMTANGLRSKKDVEAYVSRVQQTTGVTVSGEAG